MRLPSKPLKGHYPILSTPITYICVAYLVISCIMSLRFGLWFDEAYSVSLAKLPIDQLLSYAATDVHPPGYYISLKVVMSVLGDSELALRSLSFVPIALSLTLIYFALRKNFTIKVSAFITAITAFAPMTLRYGFETRMYGLVLLIATLATLLLLSFMTARKVDKSSRIRFILAYGFLLALGMYLHYYTVFIWTAHGLYVLLKYVKVRAIIVPWALAVVTSILLYLPQLPTLIAQTNSVADRTPINPVSSISLLSGSFINTFSYTGPTNDNLLKLLGTIAAFVSLLILIAAIVQPAKKYVARQPLSLLLLIALIPVGCGYLLTLKPFSLVYYDRYFLVSLTALLIATFIALTLVSKTYKKLANIFTGLLIIVMMIGSSQVLYYGNANLSFLYRNGIRDVMQPLEQQSRPLDIILVDNPRMIFETSYYNRHIQLPYYAFDTSNGKSQTGSMVLATKDKDQLVGNPEILLTDGNRVWHIFANQRVDFTPLTSWRVISEIQSDNYTARLYSR